MKIKNLLIGMTSLATISTIVVPLTSCSKPASAHISYTGEKTIDITNQSLVLLKIDLDQEYTSKDIKMVEAVTETKGMFNTKHLVDGKNLWIVLFRSKAINTFDKETNLEIKVVASNWTESITGIKLNWNIEDSSKCRLCATADTKVDISLGVNPKNVANKLEISTNGKDFEEVTADTQIKVSKGESLYFRGNNPDGVGGQNHAHTDGMHLVITAQEETETPTPSCYLMGSVMALIDNGEETATAVPDYGFCYLFAKSNKVGSTGIEYVSEDFLPADTVGNHAYQRMFNNASNLLATPELPADTLSAGAYEHMFSGCASLLQTPELELETLPDYVYQSMFNECSNVIKVGLIHATALGNYSCDNMFCDNKSLQIKEVTDLTDPNYFFTCPVGTEKLQVNQMFGGCKATPAITPEAGKSYAWYYE